MERDKIQYRTLPITTKYEKRAEGDEPRIEGYFSVYDSVYEIVPGMMSESIAPGAFQNSISGDVRMLVNHDSTLVIGRTAAGTMTLRDDTYGLWASAPVNPKDSAAMDAYARVERGDVTQASIGFEIIREDAEHRADGSVHWTIREAKLWEVSVCTFPAYQDTNIAARTRDREELEKRRADAWRTKMKARLQNGTESADAEKED